MQDSDLVILRNEANASPDRFQQWDPNRQFRREYYERHGRDPTYEEILNNAHANGRSVLEGPVTGATEAHEEPLASPLSRKEEEEEAPLSRQTTSSSTNSSVSSRSTAQGARLEEIRTARSTNTRPRGYTDSTQQSSGTVLQRHPTERHPVAITRIETHRSCMQAPWALPRYPRAWNGPSHAARRRNHCPAWVLVSRSRRRCRIARSMWWNLTAMTTLFTHRTGQ